MAFASRLGNILYNASFTLWFILTMVIVAGSCVSIVLQARLASRGVANWNVLVVVGCYVLLGIIAAIIFIYRRHRGVQRLKTIPKPYVAIKKGDVPRAVADLVSAEYTRSAMVAALSRPKKIYQPGWGAPGTPYANIQFRIAILNTIPEIDNLARKFLPDLPPMRPHRHVVEHLRKLDFVLLQDDFNRLKDYGDIVEQARYDEEEPTEEDWERCNELVEQMKSILNFYLRAGAGLDPSAADELSLPDVFHSATSSPVPPFMYAP